MKTKPFYKSILFWSLSIPLVVGLVIVAPYLKFLFKYYVYNPAPNPPAEEFFTLPGETPPEFQGLKGMPPEVVEVKADETTGTKLVEHHRDGYSLELPDYLSVSTWDMEPSTVMVVDVRNDEMDCNARVYKLENDKTVHQTFEKSLKYYKEEEDMGLYKILRHELEPIEQEGINVKAYIQQFEEDMFGYQPTLLIQGKDEVFGISQNGMRYPECTLMMEVLKGLKIKN